MKQNAVAILMYLFEHYMLNAPEIDPHRDVVEVELSEMGFTEYDIHTAFDWLEELIDIQNESSAQEYNVFNSTLPRIYCDTERQILGADGIGFLMFLEQSAILTPANREMILERLVALQSPIDLQQLKWICMIVLYSNPNSEHAYTQLEGLVFETQDYIH